MGSSNNVKQAKADMIQRFDCDVIGNMDKYVGCKLNRNHEQRSLKFTQPVMIQSFSDEFDVENTGQSVPATAGQILARCDPDSGMTKTMQKKYRSGTRKLLHMMRWS